MIRKMSSEGNGSKQSSMVSQSGNERNDREEGSAGLKNIHTRLHANHDWILISDVVGSKFSNTPNLPQQFLIRLDLLSRVWVLDVEGQLRSSTSQLFIFLDSLSQIINVSPSEVF